jgi:alpha-L-fucosidase
MDRRGKNTIGLRKLTTSVLFLCFVNLCAGYPQGGASQDRESDPLVLKKLSWFQDQKFGLMMHWGPYSQWGVVESWMLCSEDELWCQRNMDNYVEYCIKYERLKETFNPVKFDPESWAAAARYAGMKYLVFTTKHHEEFCMFDTRQTDYRITDVGCP